MIDTEATHGRWPLVAATLVGPAVIATWARRSSLLGGDGWIYWLPLPALLLHQTEEWVRPGGFLPWFNRNVMGSSEDEWPITKRDGLIINVAFGWGVAATAALPGTRRPMIAAMQLAMDLANSGLHTSQAVRERRYNPGLATALLLFAPLGVGGSRRLLADPGSRHEAALGLAIGAVASAAMMVTMKMRVRRRRRRLQQEATHPSPGADPHTPADPSPPLRSRLPPE